MHFVKAGRRWQAPEFLEDEDTLMSPSSDVWSFACTAFEVRTHVDSLYFFCSIPRIVSSSQVVFLTPTVVGFITRFA